MCGTDVLNGGGPYGLHTHGNEPADFERCLWFSMSFPCSQFELQTQARTKQEAVGFGQPTPQAKREVTDF